MQNAGHFGQGGASSHQSATYGHTESAAPGGSKTSSLRQFRKKDVEKQQVNDTGSIVAESHVARVAPHNHYPPRPQDCYRYPSQYPDYSLPSQVKYSEISDHQPLQDQISSTVIQKAKSKEYMEMCNVAAQAPHLKQSYVDHVNNQQPYVTADHNIHPHAQYLQKDPQIHPSYKPESQYYPKEAQYQQLPHQMQKYNVPPQMRKFPTENDFLSKLRRIHPTMARSIMSDHHLQESQNNYQTMDQSRMYPHQNQRYMNYPTPLQTNPYGHSYMPQQPYSNYPASCSYTRSPQMPPRFPSTNPHERSISPRRSYGDNLPISPMNYPAMPQRISPSYPQYNPTPEYSQHYQHRRGPVAPQEYYPQPCRTTQYLPHQMASQEIAEASRVTVSDSIKQYIENWADEETASEMNQIETNRLCKENLRIRDDQSTETVYMINASELQFNLENGIPLVASENGIPLVTSENGQYFIKSGVTIDNSTGMVRIVDKTNQSESANSAMERIVNLHIMDPSKSDCMLASKPNETNQRQIENPCQVNEKAKVVIHQNTVIQPGQNIPKQPDLNLDFQTKIGTSLPVLLQNGQTTEDNVLDSVFKECKKETVDKNCSPINMEQIDDFDNTSTICPLKLLEHSEDSQHEDGSQNGNDSGLKNMPIIDLLPECLDDEAEENIIKDEPVTIHKDFIEEEITEGNTVPEKEKDISEIVEDNLCNNLYRNDKEGVKNEVAIDSELKPNVNDLEEMILEHEEQEPSEEKIHNLVEEETKEDLAESKDVNIEEQCSANINKEDVVNTEDSQVENEERTANLLTQELPIEEKKEKDENIVKDYNFDQGKCIENVPEQDSPKEKDEEKEESKINLPTAKEEKPRISVPIISTPTIDITTTKRTKRIFSVDDIINNIGNNTNKPKPIDHLTERRRSLQITREFLEQETNASYVFHPKPMDINPPIEETVEENLPEVEINETNTPDQIIKEKEISSEEEKQVDQGTDKEEDMKQEEKDISTEEPHRAIDISEESPKDEPKNCLIESDIMDVVDTEKNEETGEKQTTYQVVEATEPHIEETSTNTNDTVEPIEENLQLVEEGEEEELIQEPNDCSVPFVEDPLEIKEANTTEEETICADDYTNKISTDSVADNTGNELEQIDEPNQHEDVNSQDTSPKPSRDFNIKENTVDSITQNEVQYRNAIRVDENNVLLEIAGELVEISVNLINGKKVITVVPLSETTVVDFNDNYETLDTTQVHESLKACIFDNEDNLESSQMFSLEEVPPEPDVIESTSEIIIGMDISLEEEIQLDLEKPSSLSTKAAKKSYDNDLQIPSITTSEDITDNTKSKSYSPNDKVSSSKEQRSDKFKSEKKKTSNSKKSSLKNKPKRSDSDKSVTKELMKIRKVKKTMFEDGKAEEEEEFVPFKDLIEARKLKKIKLLQLKTDENVSADSTNKLDQEEDSETETETKDCRKQNDEDRTEVTDSDSKSKETCSNDTEVTKLENIVEEKDNEKTNDLQSPKIEEKETNKPVEKETVDKPVTNTNISPSEKITEKPKKVTFADISYDQPKKIAEKVSRTSKLEDPRVKLKPTGRIMVPSVSELLRETEGVPSHKRKLSLAEYNSRKRKLNQDQEDKEAKIRKKSTLNTPPENGSPKPNTDVTKPPKAQPSSRSKILRPKSLDDINLFGKPKDHSLVKRKFSLEVTSSKPNYFDWEETQSPKTNVTSHEGRRLSEFRGLINHNKSKIVVDVSDLNKPVEPSEDEILQNYKEQVDSKLNSLNLKIPRVAKPTATLVNHPFSITLMQKFLKNEKLSAEEMEKIKKIISYKRLMQQLDKIKSPGVSNSPLNPSYEIRRTSTEKEMKLHLKKVPEKKKKRFRNLYAESSSESESDFEESGKGDGDYSVVQSNSVASAGVPKLIIKRKTEMPVPVVRLERLDLKVLFSRKRKVC